MTPPQRNEWSSDGCNVVGHGALAAIAVLVAACGLPPRREAPRAPAHQSAISATPGGIPHSSTQTPSTEPAQAQEVSAAHFEQLDVSGYPPALVWVPAAKPDTAVPLVVVSHGAGGGPTWHCRHWSQIVRDTAFLLCLRGKPLGNADGHYFPEHHTLGRILSASVEAFDARFGARTTSGPGVYIGYSQGATMGAWALNEHASRFGLALLIEGGYREWNVQRALEFRDAGGQAICLVCGTQTCFKHATRTVRWLKRGGVDARVTYAEGAGHTPAGPVGEAAADGLDWLRKR